MALLLVALVLAISGFGFGLGYVILREGGGFHRGTSTSARGVVGLLVCVCVIVTLYEIYAGIHFPMRSGGDMDFPGLAENTVACASGLVGAGLFVAFLCSL